MSLRIPFPFPLRPDFMAFLVLPIDLTRDEAERLARYIFAICDDTDTDEG